MIGNQSSALGRDGLLAQILNSKAFSQIQPEILKKLVARIEMIPVTASETIVRQGEVGDSFYIVREGRCRIVNYTSVEDDTVEIATLGPGDSFGEEALIRNAPRNATVEMLGDGSLARLSKDDFEELIKKPLLQGIDPWSARQLITNGAIALDIRDSSEFARYSIKGSRSVPLAFLRQARRGLEKDKVYVACSDNELQSALAAFLLAQKGIDARYLACSVADYLHATGDYDHETVSLPGAREENVIEFPEEEMALNIETVSSVASSFRPDTPAVPTPRTTVDERDPVSRAKAELARALAAQNQIHLRELTELKQQYQQMLDARSKLLMDEFRKGLRDLESRLSGHGRPE